MLLVSASAQNDDPREKAERTGSEWNDIEVFEQNRFRTRTNVIPYDDENGIEKWEYLESSRYVLLDEGWKVDYTPHFIDRATEIEGKTFNPSKWQPIEWPDVRWLAGGKAIRMPNVGRGAEIPTEGNATATFHTDFDVPKTWADYDAYLQLQPLSACYVWVNQKYVGYTEDGRMLSEFDITNHLQPGKRNSVTLQMVSLSTSNLLEMNRDPHHLGMASDVAICLKPSVNVLDYALRASYQDGTGALALDFIMSNRSRKGRYYAEVELWNPQGRQVMKMGRWFAFDKRSETPVSITRQLNKVLPWTAETPNLYTLVVRLLGEDIKPIETVGTRFGFRTVEVSEGQLRVNGEAVTLKGVVYGDYTTDEDGVVDYELVENDLKLLKRHNVNAIRTSVYSPADPHFYELCDKYGFYVVCDANLHPYSTKDKAIATDNGYEELFVSRVQNLYERFKNQTCIIAWSLGESGDNGACMMSAFRNLKMKDNSRPIIFAGAGQGENTDIVALQQATLSQLRQYAGRMQSRPMLMLSFGSSQGNSLGGLEPLWQQVEKNANIQGGFFANWNELRFRDVETGADRHSDGLMSSERTVSPGLAQLDYLYRPFDVGLRSFSTDAGEFSIENRTDFMEGQDYTLEYTIYTGLKPKIIAGEVPALPDAGSSKAFKLMIPKLTLYAGEEMFIRFTLKLRHDIEGVARGTELYSVQYPIPMRKVARQQVSYEMCKPLKVSTTKASDTAKSAKNVVIASENATTTIDLHTGEITSYKFRERELLKAPVRLNFFRVPTDNDLSERSIAKQWQVLRPDQLRREVTDIAYNQIDDNSVAVDMMVRYSTLNKAILMDVRQTLLLLSTGDIIMSCDIMSTDASRSLPRVGLQLQIDKRLSQVQWMGDDIECYADRRGSGRVQSNKASVNDLFYRYPRPQEAGTRGDLRWLTLTDDNVGLFFNMSDTHFYFSVYPYDDIAMAKAKDFKSLKESNHLTLNIDSRMTGIGSALGGIDVPETTLINGRKHHFMVHFCAYDLSEYDPFDFCRIEYPKISSNVLEMPSIERDRERFDGPLTISIKSPDKGVTIRYTLDGSEPSEKSPLYDKPFVIENTTLIKARAFRTGDAPSFTAQLRCDFAYITSVAYDKKPNTPYNHNASKALFDGVEGDVSDLSYGWIGFSGGEMGATFQLAKPLNIEGISIRFAHNPEAWIFAPKEVTVYVSYDGQTFIDWKAAEITYRPEDQSQATPTVFTLSVKADYTAVKAVRIIAKGIDQIPDWHRAKGLKPWLMIDEFSVKERMK